jgi:hypothetical protein
LTVSNTLTAQSNLALNATLADADDEVGTLGQVLASTTTGTNWIDNSPLSLSDTDTDTKIQVEEMNDEDKIRFDTQGVERMIIDNEGKVGIGTENPKANLTITGQARAIKAGFNSALALNESTPSADYDLANKIVISSNTGFVSGLYTGGLHITRRLYDQTFSDYGAGIRAIGDNTPLEESSLEIYTSQAGEKNRTRIKIVEDGKVGIGTTSPTDDLHVDGDVRITGTLKDASNLAGTAGQVLSSTSTGTNWIDSYAPDSGSVTHTTLRWNGSAWVQNASLLSDGSTTATVTTDLTVGGNTSLDGTLTVSDTLTAQSTLTLNATLADAEGEPGTLGQVLASTTTGTNWIDNSPLSLSDTDTDTKIQVEESADEDKIRFDLEGTEQFVMDGPRLEVVNSGESVFIGENAGANDDLILNRNVFIGYNSGSTTVSGSLNTAVGARTLEDNTTGDSNTAMGTYALTNNTSGDNNTANGRSALQANTTGDNNTALGKSAMEANTTGIRNTATGFAALNKNIGGGNNTALGFQAMADNIGGDDNIAQGYNSLLRNISGSRNTAQGLEALAANTSGHDNAGLGYRVLTGNTTGGRNTGVGNLALFDLNITDNSVGNNTAIGYDTGRGLVTGKHNTILGANVGGLSSALSNNIIIADGQGNQRIRVVANGDVGIGTLSPTLKLDVDGKARVRDLSGTTTSTDQVITADATTGELKQAGTLEEIAATTEPWYGTDDDSGATTNTEDIYITGNIGVGTATLTASKVATFAGDVDIQGVLDPTKLIFSGDGSVGSFNPTSSNQYEIEFQEGRDLEIKSNTTNNILHIQNNGHIGLGTTTPNAPLQFSNTTGNRKLVLYEDANNDNEFYGFGINSGILRYKLAQPVIPTSFMRVQIVLTL